MKRPIDNEMACLEHETEVADREAMHQAIVAMGFYPTIRIVKVRRWCSIGELTICVDEVEHAGTFMEIERTVRQDESGAAVQVELDAFARGLGVELDRTSDTDDSLVRSALASV
ncbi:CYTH domain-containing protein [Nonomuraea longispora]|uniref:CYTH domain-containing protein n=1 Tax=Nonomuraea longispora TaxID=1848320 RepID=UPI00319DD40D